MTFPEQQYNKKSRPVPYPTDPETPQYIVTLRLGGFSWIDDYLECVKLGNRIVALGEERRDLEARPSDLSSFEKRVKLSFERLRSECVEWLKSFLLENLESPDPLKYLQQRKEQGVHVVGARFIDLPPYERVKEAMKRLPEHPDAISNHERRVGLEKVEAENASLKVKVGKLSPALFFVKQHGKVVGDTRELFVRKWWDVQKETSGACNVLGQDLNQCPEAEQEAWEKLGLAVNPYGRYFPSTV